jgi:HSP20 family protein
MKPQQAIEHARPAPIEKSPESPVFVEAEKLIERMAELTRAVARRAYEFFESRGRELGGELEDWFRAESELLRPVPATMKETDNQFTVRAEVPGFKANEIKISVKPRQLMIEGNAERTNEEKPKEESEKVIFCERRANRFYRSFMLPAEINLTKVAANLKDGELEIILPKIPARPSVDVEVKTT